MWYNESPIITDNRNFRERIPATNAYFDAAKEEMLALPMEEGVITKENLVMFVDCPVCGSLNHRHLFVKWGIEYKECMLCTHIFARNQFRPEVLSNFYHNSQTDKLDRVVQTSSVHRDYWGQVYKKYLRILLATNQYRSLLDVGCGAGEFLSFCKTNCGLDLYACELAEDTYDNLRQLIGEDNLFFGNTMEQTDFKGKRFDIITFWGVIEHIANPHLIFRKFPEMLSDNGCILILIPNLHSHAFRILGVETPTLTPRAHINFFTPKSMRELCKKHKIAIEWQVQELPVIDLMYPHVSYSEKLVDEIVRNNECYYHVYCLKKEAI